MKYGIQLIDDDGSNLRYVYSSKGSPGFTENATEMALFAQEATAVARVNTLRKDGFEPKGSTYSVVIVVYAILQSVPVERPKIKAGYALTLKYKNSLLFYIGAKKGDVTYRQGDFYCGWRDAEQRASVFESELKARIRLQELIEYNRRELTEAKQKRAGYTYSPQSSYMGIDRTSEYESRVQMYAESIDMLENAEIIAVGS